MPIYSYQCPSCRHYYEELVGTFQNYPEPTVCPSCGESPLERMMSSFRVSIPFHMTDEGEQDALKNKAWLESIGDEIRSGERTMSVPKNYPSRLQPKL